MQQTTIWELKLNKIIQGSRNTERNPHRAKENVVEPL